MLTCSGLVVGLVESTSVEDTLNKCAKFLKKYPHLFKCGTEFMVDDMIFATVIDTHTEDDDVLILCEDYNGSIKIGTSKF